MPRKQGAVGKAGSRTKSGPRGSKRLSQFVTSVFGDDVFSEEMDEASLASGRAAAEHGTNSCNTSESSHMEDSNASHSCDTSSSVATNMESFLSEESQSSQLLSVSSSSTSTSGSSRLTKGRKSKKNANYLRSLTEEVLLDFPSASPVANEKRYFQRLSALTDGDAAQDGVQNDVTKSAHGKPETLVKENSIRRSARNIEDRTAKAKKSNLRTKRGTVLLDNTVSDSPLSAQAPSVESDMFLSSNSKTVILKTPSARLSTDCFFGVRSKPMFGRMKLLNSDGCLDESPVIEATENRMPSERDKHLKNSNAQSKEVIVEYSQAIKKYPKKSTKKKILASVDGEYSKTDLVQALPIHESSRHVKDKSVNRIRDVETILTDISNVTNVSENYSAVEGHIGKENIPNDMEVEEGDQTMLYSINEGESVDGHTTSIPCYELNDKSETQSSLQSSSAVCHTETDAVSIVSATSLGSYKKETRDVACEARLCCSHVNIGFMKNYEYVASQNASLTDECKFDQSKDLKLPKGINNDAYDKVQHVNIKLEDNSALSNYVAQKVTNVCTDADPSIENADMSQSYEEEISGCEISLQTSMYPKSTLSQLNESSEIEDVSTDTIATKHEISVECADSLQGSDEASSVNTFCSNNGNLRVSESFLMNPMENFSLRMSPPSEELQEKLIISESFEEVSACSMSLQTSVFEKQDTSKIASDIPEKVYDIAAKNLSEIPNSGIAEFDIQLAEEVKSDSSLMEDSTLPDIDIKIASRNHVKPTNSSIHPTNVSESYLDVTAQHISIQTSVRDDTVEFTRDESHNSTSTVNCSPIVSAVDDSADNSLRNEKKCIAVTDPCEQSNEMNDEQDNRALSNPADLEKVDNPSDNIKSSIIEGNVKQVMMSRRESFASCSPNIMLSARSNRRRSSWLPNNFNFENRGDICSSTHRRSQIAPILDELDDLSPIAIAAYYEGRRYKKLSIAPRRVTLCGLEENDSVEEQVSNSSGDIFYTPPPGQSVAKRRQSVAAVVLLSDTDEEGDVGDRKKLTYDIGSEHTAHYRTACVERMSTEHDEEDDIEKESSDTNSDCQASRSTSEDELMQETVDSRGKSSRIAPTSCSKLCKPQKTEENTSNLATPNLATATADKKDDDDGDDPFENFLHKVKGKSSARMLVEEEAEEDNDMSGFIVDNDDDDDVSQSESSSDASDDDVENDSDYDDDNNSGDDDDDASSSESDELPDISQNEDNKKPSKATCITINDSEDDDDDFKKPVPVKEIHKEIVGKQNGKQSEISAKELQNKAPIRNLFDLDLSERLKNLSVSSSTSNRGRPGAAYYDVPPAVPEKLKRTPVTAVCHSGDNAASREFVLPSFPASRKSLEDFEIRSVKTKSVDDDEFRTPVLKRPAQRQWFPHSTGHSLERLSFIESLSTKVMPQKRHPEAQRFISLFANLRQELSAKLFKLFNENVFDNKLCAETPIMWNDRMTKSAGYCSYKRQNVTKRSVTINLSVKVCDNAERLRDTLIHEMCHAAVWIIHEVNDGHGKFWKYWAYKANKAYRELPPILRCHSYQINTKFIYRCTKCGYEIGRHSKSLDTTSKVCGYCGGTFELLLRSKSQDSEGTPAGASGTPYKSPALSGFAKFVRDNYREIKSSTPGSLMKDTMKKASELYNERKAAAAAEKSTT